MQKLLILLSMLIFACNSPGNNEQNDNESTTGNATNNNENVEVLFSCDTLLNSNQRRLSVLLSTYNEAIAIDTVNSCDSIPKNQYGIYDIPEKIEGVALGDNDIYYGTIKEKQLIIMKSPKGDNLKYEAFLSIPIQPAVKEGEKQ